MANPFDQFDSTPSYKRERDLAMLAADTPEEATRTGSQEAMFPRLEELDAAIAAAKTPETKALLMAEKQKRTSSNPFDQFDRGSPASAKPATLARKATPPLPEESPTSFKNLVGAAIEPMAAIASGAIAAPVAGISGLGAAALGAMGMTGMDGAKQVEKVQNALTYRPKTVGGQNAMKVIGAPFEAMAEGAENLGRWTQDATGSPALATQVETAGKFIPGFFGVKALKGRMPDSSAPKLSPEVEALQARGIRMTPGELLGGGWSRAEQALSSFPVVGEFVKSARNRSLRDFTNATLDDALESVNAKVPKELSGKDAVAWTRTKLGEMYDETLSQATGRLRPDQPVGTPGVPTLLNATAAPSLEVDVANVIGMARSSKMPRSRVAELKRIVQQEVTDRFQSGGVASGETIKAMQSDIQKIANAKRINEHGDVRNQARALDEINASIKRMMERENPDLAGQLADIDKAYGKFKVVQKAASSAASDSGIFTPAQFMQAVRAKDVTKDKRAFSEGTARSQDLATAGKKVLSNTLPDSGTPTRLMVARAILEGGGTLGGHLLAGVPGMAAALAVPAMYSAPGVALLQKALTAPRPTGNAASLLYGMLDQSEPQQRKR